MVQKKLKKFTLKKTSVEGRTNYPILSFILFVVACLIWYYVGHAFMTLAVEENFCQIRYSDDKIPTGEIVAVIAGEPLYMSEIQDYADSIPQLKELPLKVVYPQLLDTVITSRVLKKAADKANIADQEKVKQALILAHDQIVAQAYLEQELKGLITDERLKALYDEDLKSFKPVDEVRAKHILVKTEKEAKDIAIQLKAGVAFSVLANKYSLDKSSPDGDLGYFTEGMMIPEFGRVVFAMKKGQISDPIKTPFGWHIVSLEDRRQSMPPAFEDVKNELRKVLMEQDVANVLAKERERMKVEIKKPAL